MCRAPSYRPNFDLVDESTARTIQTNIRNSGTEALYRDHVVEYAFGRYGLGPRFIEHSYVEIPGYKVGG